MELNKKYWYVQWFFLSLRVIDNFTGGSSEYRYESRGTNLCHFMRIVLVWAPLVMLLNITAYALVFGFLIAMPLYQFGLAGSLSMYGGIVAFIVVILLLCVIVWAARAGVVMIADGTGDLAYSLRKRREQAIATRSGKPPTFVSLVWQYAVTTKQRICLKITFSKE